MINDIIMYPEFVTLYVNHLLNGSIEKQFKAFSDGFHSICNSRALEVSSSVTIESNTGWNECYALLFSQLFRPEEIERLVCGCPEFDIKALEQAANYDGYRNSDTTIR